MECHDAHFLFLSIMYPVIRTIIFWLPLSAGSFSSKSDSRTDCFCFRVFWHAGPTMLPVVVPKQALADSLLQLLSAEIEDAVVTCWEASEDHLGASDPRAQASRLI